MKYLRVSSHTIYFDGQEIDIYVSKLTSSNYVIFSEDFQFKHLIGHRSIEWNISNNYQMVDLLKELKNCDRKLVKSFYLEIFMIVKNLA